MRSLFDTACAIAAGQHGLVTRAQLLAAGIDADRIRRWLADGRLHRVHRGVHAVGPRLASVHAGYTGAVLACGDGAHLSHRAAGYLMKVVPARVAPVPEVTVPTTADRSRPGIVVHRVRVLPAEDLREFEGIRVTTVPRILLDLAPGLSLPDLTRACHEAWIRGTRPHHIRACIERNPHKHGAGRLRIAIGEDVTLSMLEDLFLELLRRHGLPRPRTNIDGRGDKVDCHWPQLGLTIELLSYRFHGSRRAFEADVARRRRSNHVAFTYGDVVERAPQTARELNRLLRVV
jgi:hypothetical protein